MGWKNLLHRIELASNAGNPLLAPRKGGRTITLRE
jgi:hypothetical protein